MDCAYHLWADVTLLKKVSEKEGKIISILEATWPRKFLTKFYAHLKIWARFQGISAIPFWYICNIHYTWKENWIETECSQFCSIWKPFSILFSKLEMLWAVKKSGMKVRIMQPLEQSSKYGFRPLKGQQNNLVLLKRIYQYNSYFFVGYFWGNFIGSYLFWSDFTLTDKV